MHEHDTKTASASDWHMRPVSSLFPVSAAPTVGSGDLGELIIQVTPSALERAFTMAGNAEDVLQYKPKKDKPDVMEPNPSRARSEVGAIESIALWSAADRRNFDIDDAVKWFKGRAVPRAYRVDLFDARLFGKILVSTPCTKEQSKAILDSSENLFQIF